MISDKNEKLSADDFLKYMYLSNERTIAVSSIFKCGNSIHLKIPKEMLSIIGLIDDEGRPHIPAEVTFKLMNGHVFIRRKEGGDLGRI